MPPPRRDRAAGPAGRLRLSELLRAAVLDQDGRRLGRVADLTVLMGSPQPRAHRLVVSTTRTSGFVVGWDDVEGLAPTSVVLGAAAATGPRKDPRRPDLAPDELLLARDVLDTQVVDLRGNRLSRVSDVLLARAGTTLTATGVDLGVAGIARRLGLGAFVRAWPSITVDWADLHLTSRRGHLVQLSTSAANFRRLDAGDLAELLARLTTTKAIDVIRTVEPARAAAALHRSHPKVGRGLVRRLSAGEREHVLAAAPTDRAGAIARGDASPRLRRRFLRTGGWRVHRPPRTGS